MLLFVYQLRFRDKPRLPGQAAARPVYGFVSFRQGAPDLYPRGVKVARLLDPKDRKTDLIPSLSHATIETLHGFVQIRGVEHFKKSIKSRTHRWEQSWLCCSTHDEGVRILLKAEARRRLGQPLDQLAGQPYRPSLAEQARRERLAVMRQVAFDREFDEAQAAEERDTELPR